MADFTIRLAGQPIRVNLGESTAIAARSAERAEAAAAEAVSALSGKQNASPRLQALADVPIIENAILIGGDESYELIGTSNVGRTVLAGTAAQARAALDAGAAVDVYNATIGIGDVTEQVTGSGSEVFNGAVLNNPLAITVPSGQVGNVSYIRINWPFNGAAHAGKTFRFRWRLGTSETFDRALIYAFAVATNEQPYVDRTATITTQTVGSQVVVQFDYVVQGDETAIRPFAMIDPAQSNATASNQTFQVAGFSAGVISTNNGILTAADENIALLRESILSQTILRPPYAERITVKPSGGDFTTLSAAIAAVTDSSAAKQYLIAWHAGATIGTPDFHVPAWTSIICQDPRDDAVMSFANPNGASASAITNTSLMWLDEDGIVIEGGTWQITNGRYVFHWETNGSKLDTTQRLIGLKGEHLGNAEAINNEWVSFSQYACGCGVSAGQVQIVEDCDLRGPGGGFSSHSPNGGQPWAVPFRILLSNSRFEATDAANRDLLLKPIALGRGEARIQGCSYDELGYFDGEWIGGDPGSLVNTAQIAVYGSGNANLARNAPPSFFNGLVYGNATGRAYTPRFTGRA